MTICFAQFQCFQVGFFLYSHSYLKLLLWGIPPLLSSRQVWLHSTAIFLIVGLRGIWSTRVIIKKNGCFQKHKICDDKENKDKDRARYFLNRFYCWHLTRVGFRSVNMTLHRTSKRGLERNGLRICNKDCSVGVRVWSALEVKVADEGIGGLDALDSDSGGNGPELLSLLLSARETAEGSELKVR